MRRLSALIGALVLGAAVLVTVATGCGQPSPSQTINNALNNRQSSHADFNTSAQFNLKAGDQAPLGGVPITVTATGGADMDNNTHNSQGNVDISGLDLIRAGLSAAGIATSQSGIINLLNVASDISNFAMVDGTIYVKVSDTWYIADSATLSALLGPVSSTLGNVNTNIDTQCMTSAIQDTSKFGADTIFTNLQEQSSQQVDGVDTRHFTGSINFDAILSQLSTAAAGCGSPDAATGLDAARRDIASLFNKADVELWVDSSNNIRQMKSDFVVNGPVAQTVIGILGGIGTAQVPGFELDTVEITNTTKFSQFGATFNIAKPQQASFGNLSSLVGGSAGTGGTGTGGAANTTGGTGTGTTTSDSGTTSSGY